MAALRFAHNRSTWAGSYRDEIPSRERGLVVRPEQFIGLLRIELPGYSLNWTLLQDMRDMRRFRAVDLEGIQKAHAAPREMMRQLALVVPHYGAR